MLADSRRPVERGSRTRSRASDSGVRCAWTLPEERLRSFRIFGRWKETSPPDDAKPLHSKLRRPECERTGPTAGAGGRRSWGSGLGFFGVFFEDSWRCRSALLGVLLLVGCAPKLMPTPYLYATAHQPLFEDLRPELQGTQIDVLYVTDRVPEDDGAGSRRYGYERSTSVGYGSAVLEIGRDMSWDELVSYSTKRSPRYGRPALRIDSVTELGRLPATPYDFRIQARGDVALAPEALAEWDEALAKVRSELVERLALTRRKEVFVFVHHGRRVLRGEPLEDLEQLPCLTC